MENGLFQVIFEWLNIYFIGFRECSKQGNLADPEVQDFKTELLKYVNQTRRTNLIETEEDDGLMFHSVVEDLQNDLDFDELVDIRENSAYVAFVQLIGGYINYDEDGYEILAKEYKRELKYAGGNLMQLQLREIVDKSVKDMADFFDSFPSFDTFQQSFDEVEDAKNRVKQRKMILKKTASAYDVNPDESMNKSDVKNIQSQSTKKVEFDKKGNIMCKLF